MNNQKSSISNVKIFVTNIANGPMDFKSYYEEYKNDENENHDFETKKQGVRRLKENFLKKRLIVGKEYGFDGRKIIIPKSEGSRIKQGSYFIADESVYNKKDDLVYLKVPGEIVLLKRENPGIVIAYPVSDDPVIIVEDKENGICALAHCSIDKISRKLPEKVLTVLKTEANSNISNLKVYIGPHIKRDHNMYLIKPKSVRENYPIWKGCTSRKSKQIKKVKKIKRPLLEKIAYKIDVEKAITKILIKKGIKPENIEVSNIDTYESFMHYSSRFAKDCKEPFLEGKFLVGAYYNETFPEYEESPNVRTL